MQDLANWLESLGLGQYAAVLREHDIDGELLSELSEADLEKMDIRSLGHGEKPLKAIAPPRNTIYSIMNPYKYAISGSDFTFSHGLDPQQSLNWELVFGSRANKFDA